jgi:flagellar hook-length control protein FliK
MGGRAPARESAGDSQDTLPDAFAAQLAQLAEADPSAPLDAAGAAPPDKPAAGQSDSATDSATNAPADPSLSAAPAAAQWLLSMLGQREVTLQARDGNATPSSDSGATASAGAASAALRLRNLAAGSVLPPLAQGLGQAQAQPAQGQPLLGLPTAKAPRALPETLPAKAVESSDDALRSHLEQLASQIGASTQPAPPAGASQTTPVATHGVERQLTLQAPSERWGEQLLNALRDSVELQLKHSQQSASIRLDPPELGRLEIYLSQDSARLTVQIHAAQGDVARLLQQGVERLRQDLSGPGQQQVDVQVSDGRGGQQQAQQQSQQGRPAPWFEEAPLGAAAEPSEEPGADERPRDVLVTV